MLAAVAQALLFSVVLPRVKGITFALVTLGMSSVFHIVIMSRELGDYTGADVGLQGVIVPDFISPATERLRLYFVALTVLVLFYLLYRRFVDSPTGRVCKAIRENEGRAQMLGYNTFLFKLAALILSSITAAIAGALHTIYQPIVTPRYGGVGVHRHSAAHYSDRRRRDAQRRAGGRSDLSPARFWSAPLPGRER